MNHQNKASGLTTQQVTLQVLAQAEVGGSQRLVELVETSTVVLALEVVLDDLEQLLEARESGVELGELAVLGQGLLEKLCVALLGLLGLVLQLLEDGVGGLARQLDATAEVGNLDSQAVHCAFCARVDNGLSRLVRNLIGDWLLGGAALVGGDCRALACGGLEDELEDLE
jgi:hypothetical protein